MLRRSRIGMRAMAFTRTADRIRTWGGALALALVAFGAGVVLAAIGDRFHPALILGLPLAGLITAAILSRPALGVVALYAAFPASFLDLPTDALGLQAAEVVTILVVGVTVFRRLGTGEALLAWAPPMWWAAAFIVWALIATPRAIDLDAAIRQDGQLIAALLMCLVVLSATRDMRDVRLALTGLVVVGAGMAAFGLQNVNELRTTFGGAVGINRAAGVFPQPNDLGAFAAILLMVSVGWSFGARGRGGRIFGVAAAAVTALALMFSLSRGAWIGTVLGGALMLVLLPQARRAVLLGGIPLVVVGVSIILVADPPDAPQIEVVRERLSTFTRPTDNPYDDRPSIYREAIREIREHPVTGSGPGNFPAASLRAGSESRTVGAIHAHNLLLTVAAEIGITGAVLLVGLTYAVGISIVRGVRRLRDPRERALAVGVACGLVVQIGQGIVDFNLRNPVLLLLMASLVGLGLAIRREADVAHTLLEETRA